MFVQVSRDTADPEARVARKGTLNAGFVKRDCRETRTAA
jgi:hypothetical protein